MLHFIKRRAGAPIILLFLLILPVLQVVAEAQGPVRSRHVEAQLIAEAGAIQPGNPFWVGVSLRHDPHWHTYWVNSGDSGLETMLVWDLPDGFEAGEIQWPYPEYIEMGGLVTYGFERDILLMVQIKPPGDLSVGDEVTLKVRADWLECKEVCLPGGANLALTLPVSAEMPELHETWAPLFEEARAEWPLTDSGWSFAGTFSDGRYQILAFPPEVVEHDIGHARFYALDPELVEYLPPQQWRWSDDGYYTFELRQDQTFGHQPDRIRGVLVSDDGWMEPDTEGALYVEVELTESLPEQVAATRTGVGGMGAALIFAFLGGILLNLMPCVFPVISMKIMGFVQQAEQGRGHIFTHGALFGFGVLVSFWVLAGALIALRAGGEQLGWGFHLQSAPFLLGMSILFFLLALNLFGVFEVGTSWMGLGQKAASKSTWTGSFFSGVLATVIATPCTAPFMGAALGYALTLSPVEALSVFSLLGLGMASPYVLLSAFPKWLSRIPKPGPWMESFKQAVGWVFILVVVHLAHVLHVMAGGTAVLLLLYVMCVVGIGAWILGRWGAIHRNTGTRITGCIIATVLLVLGLGVGLAAARHLGPVDGADGARVATGGMPWEPFSVEKFETLRAEGKPVFINFTAAWCLSCQVNERTTLSTARVVAAFRERGITPLKADWTNRDDVIEGVLAGYGRSSVPFYVLYGEGRDAEPVTLPEILRPGIVLDAIDRMF